ncbi:MAG: hypothetical protein LCH88_15255 [Proteobacteria bacterium]|nr:hypothetical protein [Pseudomonadota bacterium]
MTIAAATATDCLQRDARLGARWAWCIGLAILLLPLVAFSQPYLQDFPNHLSRIEIARAINDPAIAANYELLPLRPGNAAFDVVVTFLSAFMPPVEAGRLYVIVALVMIATGALALRRAFGLPIDIVALAGLPFIYSASFSYGFLPYLMGMGLALHCMALWVRADGWPPGARWLLAPAAMLLAATHFYTLGIFAIFAAAETWQRRAGWTMWRSGWFWLRGLSDGLVLVPAVLFLFWAADTDKLAGTQAIEWSLEKPIQFFTTALGFGPWWMSLVALGAWAAIVGLAARRSRRYVDPRAVLAAAAMVAAFVVMPHRLGDLYSVDWRILNCAAPVFLAGLRLDLPEAAIARMRLQLLGFMGALALALSWVWLPAAAARADVLAITEQIPPGSRLFWSVADPGTAAWVSSAGYGLYHAASHAAAVRRILVSTTFALPGQHPLRFRDPLLRQGGNLSMLSASDLKRDLTHHKVRVASIVTRFDYALIYRPASATGAMLLPLSHMSLVATRGALQLYAIRPGSP